MSSKNPGKKNKAKLEKAAAEKAAEDRKKAKKTATKEQKAEIRAEEKAVKNKEKEKKKQAKAKEKEQAAADKAKYKQLKKEYDEKLEAIMEKSVAASDDEETAEAEAPETSEAAEDTAAVTEETSDAEPDEAAEDGEEPEEDSIFQLCRCCGERNAQYGKEYCSDCEKLLLRTHLPVRGFVIALVSVIASFCVLVLMGLLSSASLQIAKGDYYMDEQNYNTAFTVYDDVASIISSINENFGDDSVFTKIVATGSNFDYRAMECAVKMYGPLSAISSFDSNIFVSDGAYYFKKYSARYKNLCKPYDEFQSTLSALDDILTDISSDEDLDLDKYNERIPEIEAYADKDGVNKVDLEYIVAMLAEQAFTIDNDQMMEYMKKVDEAAKEDGGDYSWLYYEDYSNLLVSEGEYDKATPMLMTLMENDLSNYYSRIQMCRILVAEGRSEDAAAIVNEFQENNIIDDEYTENAYALLIYMSRVLGNYETALHYATSALDTYTYVPEVRRQQAMAYMSMGYYEEAFDAAYQASSDAQYISSYYTISDFDGTLIDETLYIAAYMVKDLLEDDSDAKSNYDYVIATYSSADYVPPFAQKIIDGKVDLQKALTEGTCDFI